MTGEVWGRRGAPPSPPPPPSATNQLFQFGPLLWLLLVAALLGPFALSSSTGPATPVAAHAAYVTADAPALTDSGTAMDSPDNGTSDSPGVLGLPAKVHLIVNRTATGAAPLVPVLAVLAAPVDRTDAGIRLAAERAGTSPAGAPPPNSHWGRAPPRASA